MAAALAVGSKAVVSFASAALVHRFHGIAPGLPELTWEGTAGMALSGVVIHRSRILRPEDIEMRNGIRVTTPVRTVIDMAGRTGDYLLGRILDDGNTRRLWTAEMVAAALDGFAGSGGGPPGTTRLRRLLTERMGEGYNDTKLEQRILRVLKGKVPDPVPHFQLVLDGKVIDMDLAWPEYRIDGEIDSYDAHIQRSDFERDRVRANRLGAAGWRLVHWTSTMDDDTIIAQVRPYFR